MEKFLINLGLALVERWLFPLANRIWDKLADWIDGFYKKKETNKRVDRSTGKLVDAKTGEQIDDAADSVLDDI